MRVKVITLAYHEGLRGFPWEPLDALGSEEAILEARYSFFGFK